MKLIVGFFVSFMFIGILVVFYLVIENKGTFNKRYKYHFSTDSAAFFNVGMPLKLSGFKIGVVDKITLRDDASVYMTFSVDEENRKWITEGSVLMIIKPLIGSPYIIVYSSLDSKLLDVGSQMTILHNNTIDDMIAKLEPAINKIVDILDNVEKITKYLSREDSEIILTLKNIQKITTDLANNNSLLTAITGDDNSTKNIIKSLNMTTKIMQELHKISENISKTTSSIDKKILVPSESVIKELDYIMKDIKQKLQALDKTVKAVGSYDSEIIEIKDQISATLEKSNQIMDKVDAIMQDSKKDKVVLP
jgi:ABC-type transporter Mla subunit MlaD